MSHAPPFRAQLTPSKSDPLTCRLEGPLSDHTTVPLDAMISSDQSERFQAVIAYTSKKSVRSEFMSATQHIINTITPTQKT